MLKISQVAIKELSDSELKEIVEAASAFESELPNNLAHSIGWRLAEFIEELFSEVDKRDGVTEMQNTNHAYGDCRRALHQLHRTRKLYGLSPALERMAKNRIEEWTKYRSGAIFYCVRAYGIWEDPVIYDTEAEVDRYVAEIMEDLEDNFQWCTEIVQMTGRELGQLPIDW